MDIDKRVNVNLSSFSVSVPCRNMAELLVESLLEELKIHEDYICERNGCYLNIGNNNVHFMKANDYDYHNNIYKNYQVVETNKDPEYVMKVQTILNLKKIFHLF